MERVLFVSSDSHAGVPKELWPEYLEQRYHGLLPDLARDNEVYPTAIYLLTAGSISVTIDNPSGRRRLSTLSAGMTFGELTVIDRSPRTADVHADTPVECLVLPATTFDRMTTTHPALKMAILQNLLRNVHKVVGRLDRQVTALST